MSIRETTWVCNPLRAFWC